MPENLIGSHGPATLGANSLIQSSGAAASGRPWRSRRLHPWKRLTARLPVGHSFAPNKSFRLYLSALNQQRQIPFAYRTSLLTFLDIVPAHIGSSSFCLQRSRKFDVNLKTSQQIDQASAVIQTVFFQKSKAKNASSDGRLAGSREDGLFVSQTDEIIPKE